MEARGLRRARLRAAVVDEALIAAIALLLYAMAIQTGAAALAALGLGRLLVPLGLARGDVPALLAGLTWLGVRLAYGTLGEGGPGGATPGKRLAGLRVAGPGGAAPGYRRALLRHAVKAAAVASVVGLLAAATGRCWHDAAARTRVLARHERPESMD